MGREPLDPERGGLADALKRPETPWTSEQLVALAENEHHARTARNFAIAHRWLELGVGPGYIWGRYPVKDKPPIDTSVSLPLLQFSCTCTHRQFPCYHGMGLALLYRENPAAFPVDTVARNVSVPRFESAAVTDDPQRQVVLGAGLDALELFLVDLLRDGLDAAKTRPRASWDALANRLVDARARGLAAEVRTWPTLLVGKDGPARLLARLGRMQLLVEGFRRLNTLPGPVAADLRLALGWPPPPEGLGLEDRWQVLGRCLDTAPGRQLERVWLRGLSSGRDALVQRSLHGSRQRDTTALPGLTLQGKLRFYPGRVPLRAEWMMRKAPAMAAYNPDPDTRILVALERVGHAAALNPWIPHYPVSLAGVSVGFSAAGPYVQDTVGDLLPLPPKFAQIWSLWALGARGELELFGEWDGETLYPLSVWAGGRRLDLNLLRKAP